MERPPLDATQTEAALNAYVTAREQAVRYVLSALDPTAFDAPALPFLEVLTRVQALLAQEVARYAPEPAPVADEPGAAAPTSQDTEASA